MGKKNDERKDSSYISDEDKSQTNTNQQNIQPQTQVKQTHQVLKKEKDISNKAERPKIKNAQKQKKQVQTVQIESDEVDFIPQKYSSWPTCKDCEDKLYKGICIDANCKLNDQLCLVCYTCHLKQQSKCITIQQYSQDILFSEEIKDFLRYKKSKHIVMEKTLQELKNNNPNIILQEFCEALDYYKRSIQKIFDIDKNYQKKNIWKKEKVRQVCLNLQIEQDNFTDIQILYFQFILLYHHSTIHQFIIKNQRSQQTYSNENPPIFVNLEGQIAAARGGGSSVVIDLSNKNQQNQILLEQLQQNQREIQDKFTEIVISDEESGGNKELELNDIEQNKEKGIFKQGNQVIIDIHAQANQLRQLYYPTEEQSREREEKAKQKRRNTLSREKKNIFLERTQYAQKQQLKKEQNNTENVDVQQIIEDFINEKQKQTILSESEKLTRSKSRIKQQTLKNEIINQEEQSDDDDDHYDKEEQEEDQYNSSNQDKSNQIQSDKKQKNKENKKVTFSKDTELGFVFSQFNYVNPNLKSNDNHDIEQEMEIEQDNDEIQSDEESQTEMQVLAQLKSQMDKKHNKQSKLTLKYTPQNNSNLDDKPKQEQEEIDEEEEDDIQVQKIKQKQEYQEQNNERNKIKNEEQDNNIIENDDDDDDEEIDIQIEEVDNNNDEIEQCKKENNLSQTMINNKSQKSHDNSLDNDDIEDDQNDIENEQNKLKNDKDKFNSNYNEYIEDSFISQKNSKIPLNTNIKRVFYEDFYLGQSSETEKEDDQKQDKNNNNIINNNNENQTIENKDKENNDNKDDENHNNNNDENNEDKLNNNINNNNIDDNKKINKLQQKYAYQHFEYMNQKLDDDELTDRIIKTPLKFNAVRLFFNFEGNYTSISSLKALEDILPKYNVLSELCINLRNCFVWMELEILSRTLTKLINLRTLSINLR